MTTKDTLLRQAKQESEMYAKLIQRVREAAGDPLGKLMQDELVNRISEASRAHLEKSAPQAEPAQDARTQRRLE